MTKGHVILSILITSHFLNVYIRLVLKYPSKLTQLFTPVNPQQKRPASAGLFIISYDVLVVHLALVLFFKLLIQTLLHGV